MFQTGLGYTGRRFLRIQVLGLKSVAECLRSLHKLNSYTKAKEGKKIELLGKESDVGWPEARGRGETWRDVGLRT